MTIPQDPAGTPSPSERPCERHGDVRDFGGQRIGVGPCVDRNGRIMRHGAYVLPSRRRPILRWSVAVAALVPAILIGLFFIGAPARPSSRATGLRTLLAPAPTSSRHSLATLDCVQCHRTASNVEDARCERCHDVPLSARLSHAAHVFQGTGDTARALEAPAVPCATCHVEHRGANVRLADVDDRECGSCHRTAPGGFTRLSTLAKHPEFALVREGVESGSGLRWFNHKLHIAKVQAKFQKTCDACHERKTDPAVFSPISFSAHCAPCHEADLSDSAGTMPVATLAALGALPEPLRVRADIDDPSRAGIAGLKHADPWLLSTVAALRSTLDPRGAAAERAVLEAQVAQLQLRQVAATSAAASGGWMGLEGFARASWAAPQQDAVGGNGVRAAAAAIEVFVASITPQDATTVALLAEARRLQEGAGVAPAPSPSGAQPRIAAVRQLLEATQARATAAADAALAQRAGDLIARLDALRPPQGGPSPGNASAAMTMVLQSLATAGDPRVRAEASRLGDLGQIVQRQAAGAVDAASFDLYRQQVLRLLDATQQVLAGQRQGGAKEADALLARAGALRQRVLGADYRVGDPLAALRQAFFQNRQIDRARVDTELDAAGLRMAAPAEPVDPAANPWAPRLAQLRRQLGALAAPSRLTAAISPEDARNAIAALIGTEATDTAANSERKNRCAMCHELAPGRDRLAPVGAVGSPLLVKARFTHAPHITADNGNCETCHTSIRASTNAREVNLPGVAVCMTCHASGKQAAKATSCESCHKYHLPSTRAMVWLP